MEKLIIYDKKTKEVLNVWDKKEDVYQKLYECMASRYFFKSTWIKRISQQNNYNGTRTVKVYTGCGTVWEFIVKE